jgi:hypothetical protein
MSGYDAQLNAYNVNLATKKFIVDETDPNITYIGYCEIDKLV